MAFVTPAFIFMNNLCIYENFTLLFHTALIFETWIGGDHQNRKKICAIQQVLSCARQSGTSRSKIGRDVFVNSLKIAAPRYILKRSAESGETVQSSVASAQTRTSEMNTKQVLLSLIHKGEQLPKADRLTDSPTKDSSQSHEPEPATVDEKQ